jgi:hypothetical protein
VYFQCHVGFWLAVWLEVFVEADRHCAMAVYGAIFASNVELEMWMRQHIPLVAP